jgi:6-phosphofructokinase 1
MGRSSGFIALQVGIGGGAETIVVPERKETISSVCRTIERGQKRGKSSSIIVVAEGQTPGLSSRMAKELDRRGYSAKVCILGHTQRGGSPTAHDRVLASTLGTCAVHYLLEGQTGAMVGVEKGQVVWVPYKKITGVKKKLSLDLLKMAQILAS